MNEWAKKAILLYFRMRKVEPMDVGGLQFLDKIPVKADYADRGVRVVPPGVARYGSFLAEGVVLMPGFVNIGAWVGPRTMVDTWATVGSCAQIGADVHLSGGVGYRRRARAAAGAARHRRGRRVHRIARGDRRGSDRRSRCCDRAERRAVGVDPGHRRHRAGARRASWLRSAALGRSSRALGRRTFRRVGTTSRAHSSSARAAPRPTSRRL